MGMISVTHGMDYHSQCKLPHRQEGFALFVENPTLRFLPEITKNLAHLNGHFGITRIELQGPFLFVYFDSDGPDADYGQAVEIVSKLSYEQLEQCQL